MSRAEDNGRGCPAFRLVLVPMPDQIPALARLRQALKVLRRRFGLRCVKVEEVPWIGPADEIYSPDELSGMKRRPVVYAWRRNDEWLYVGYSSRGLARVLFGHNVIGAVEPMRQEDRVHVWRFDTDEEAMKAEGRTIQETRPRFNQVIPQLDQNAPRLACTHPGGLQPGEWGESPQPFCQACGVLLVKRRCWQRFCSADCRMRFHGRLSAVAAR